MFRGHCLSSSRSKFSSIDSNFRDKRPTLMEVSFSFIIILVCFRYLWQDSCWCRIRRWKNSPGRSLSSQRRKCWSIYSRVWVAPTCPSNVAGSPWPFAQIKGLKNFLLITTYVSILSGLLLLGIVSFGCTSCGVLIARSASKILHRTTTTQTPCLYRKKKSAGGLLIRVLVMAVSLTTTSQREIS